MTPPALRRLAPLAAALALPLPTAAADVTVRASLTSAGAEGDDASGTGPAHGTAVSDDGTLVVFTAAAGNLVPGDTNGLRDVFVRDLAADTTRRVSVATGGAQADQPCEYPRVSGDGRYVCFQTFASTLVPGDTNGWRDVFRHDLLTGTTERVSVSSSGGQGNLNAEGGWMSFDGRSVVFWSDASNLVPGDGNGFGDVFLRDMQAGTTTLLSKAVTGAVANGNAGYPAISADGAFVAFPSDASNMVGGDTNGVRDVFVLRLATGAIQRVGPWGGPQPDGPSTEPTLSADGRYVAFRSEASNLVAGDTNGAPDVFVQDLFTGTIVRASVGPGGAQADAESLNPRLSPDGAFVAYESFATNLVPGDTNGWQDAFLFDRVSGQTERVSVSTSGAQGSGLSFYPCPDADASVVAFGSFASNLVPGDTNFAADVFVRSRPDAPTPYCFGDGDRRGLPVRQRGRRRRGLRQLDRPGAAPGAPAAARSARPTTCASTRAGLLPDQPALLFAGLNAIGGGAGDALRRRPALRGRQRGAPAASARPTRAGDRDLGPGPGRARRLRRRRHAPLPGLVPRPRRRPVRQRLQPDQRAGGRVRAVRA